MQSGLEQVGLSAKRFMFAPWILLLCCTWSVISFCRQRSASFSASVCLSPWPRRKAAARTFEFTAAETLMPTVGSFFICTRRQVLLYRFSSASTISIPSNVGAPT